MRLFKSLILDTWIKGLTTPALDQPHKDRVDNKNKLQTIAELPVD